MLKIYPPLGPVEVPGVPGSHEGRGQHEAAPARASLRVPGQVLAGVPCGRAGPLQGLCEALLVPEQERGTKRPQDHCAGLVLGLEADLADHREAVGCGSQGVQLVYAELGDVLSGPVQVLRV